MRHQETYYGRTVVVTTVPQPDGAWTFRARILDPDQPVDAADGAFRTETEARRAGFAAAAAAVDRTRVSRGKP